MTDHTDQTEKIRFEERRGAGKASINGQTLLPLETTVLRVRQKDGAPAMLVRKAIAYLGEGN